MISLVVWRRLSVVWGLNGKNLMRNAWRKTGYNWFFEEGVGDDVIGDDNDGGDGANFDDESNIADMLDDVLQLGEEDSDNESDDDEMLWGEA